LKFQLDLIAHIIDEIDYLLEESHTLNLTDFLNSETLKRAFARSIEIIGEAVKNLPDPVIAQNPQVEWRKIAGMRDRLIHGYFSVDYELVWNVVINKLPTFRNEIIQIRDNT